MKRSTASWLTFLAFVTLQTLQPGAGSAESENRVATDPEDERCSRLEKEGQLFLCESNKHCISKMAVCDGRKDCADNSDEALCDCTNDNACAKVFEKCFKNLDKAISKCKQCPDGKRFVREQCEDIDECASSEDVCASQGACLNYDGGFTCVQCPKGYVAHMHNSRYFAEANKTTGTLDSLKRRQVLRRLFLCDDLNECAIDNPCGTSKCCVNTIGSFKCECPPNHAPHRVTGESGDDEESNRDPADSVCRAIGGQPLIAIAENQSIAIYDMRSRILSRTVKVDRLIVDIVAYKDIVFYAYQYQLWEYRLATDFHSLVVDLEEQDDHLISRIQRLAIDWENKRLYLLTGSSITLVNFFGRGGSIISHRGTVTSIVVDPVERYLFYSELGSVKRVHLDGTSTPKVIFAALAAVLYRNVQGGETMALDPNIRTIYYIHERVLYSFDYEGHHSVVLSTQAPYARLEPFEDRLYANYRADASGLVSLHRNGYTFTKGPTAERRPPNDVTFHTSRPRAMSVLHVAKFPESHKTSLPCFSPEVCHSGWCFPLPDPQAAGHRCVCSPGEADASCIRIRLHNYKPKNSLVSSAEINAAGLAVVQGKCASFASVVTVVVFVMARLNTLVY